jgi:hypothetical protein
MIKALGKALAAVRLITLGANRLKQFAAGVLVFLCWTIMAPGTGFTQQLFIDGNTSQTAAIGATMWTNLIRAWLAGDTPKRRARS